MRSTRWNPRADRRNVSIAAVTTSRAAGVSAPCAKSQLPDASALHDTRDSRAKRRLDLGLTKKGAARRLRADPCSLKNWEEARTRIEVRFYPRIIGFLGYNPLADAGSLGEAVRRERISRGWSRRELARRASVDE